MALSRLHHTSQQRHLTSGHIGAKGFALVSMIVLVPLLLSVLACLAIYFQVLRRKSLAQSICIQQATRMQEELKRPLTQLLALNPKAEILRARREAADEALEAALDSGSAEAIAMAKAAQEAVILQQSVFHTQQLAILTEAQRLREQGQRELRRRVLGLNASQIESPTYYHKALAVEEQPAGSPSPNYEPIALFSEGQQQRFQFAVNLLGTFPLPGSGLETQQKTECSVTLQEKDDQWESRILAAKAP